MKHERLYLPASVEVAAEVQKKLSAFQRGHRADGYPVLLERVIKKIQKLMYTQNPVVFSASSGTGLMEMSVRCTTLKRVIVFSTGASGRRWYETALGNGIPADMHEVALGSAIKPEMIDRYLKTGTYDVMTITHDETSTGVLNNLWELQEAYRKYPDVVVCVDAGSSLAGVKIEADKLGLDICISSDQNTPGLSPGLSFALVSSKAEKRAKQIRLRGYYFDLLLLLKYIREKPHLYPQAPGLSHIFALDFQMDRILKEGVENRFKRHEELSGMVQNWSKKYFKLFPEEEYASKTVTCVENTRGISVKYLNMKLGERGLMISDGYGSLKEKTFRIAHTGDMQKEHILEILGAIEDILKI